MRKITSKATTAFFEQRNFKSGNTTVTTSETETILSLHGNPIAKLDHETGNLFVSDAGWQTSTTKERLNGVLNQVGEGVFQKNHEWFWNSDERGDWLSDAWQEIPVGLYINK